MKRILSATNTSGIPAAPSVEDAVLAYSSTSNKLNMMNEEDLIKFIEKRLEHISMFADDAINELSSGVPAVMYDTDSIAIHLSDLEDALHIWWNKFAEEE